MKVFCNSKMSGTLGNQVYRIVNGQQIVSVAPSKVKQPNTLAQMEHRCKWPNVVAMYRAFKPYAKLCFEYKAKTTSDFNRFVSVNMQHSQVYITKGMANLKRRHRRSLHRLARVARCDCRDGQWQRCANRYRVGSVGHRCRHHRSGFCGSGGGEQLAVRVRRSDLFLLLRADGGCHD